MTSKKNLIPQNSQKSFYGKAVIHYLDNGTVLLQSYNTIVCEISNGEFIRRWDGWSATTAKHINSFRQMFGFAPMSKAQWCKLETA